MNQRKVKKVKKRKWYLVFIISSIIIIILIYNITSYYYSYKKDLKFKEKIAEYDFDKLKEINTDIVGFIEVDNTNISYPVVKSSDNSYYLNHSYKKEKNNIGSIFLDYRNDLDNLSKNNIIYGHGRLDNTMFGSLKNVLEKEWLDKEKYIIKISTLTYNYMFEIFSAYHIPTTNDYLTTNFSSKSEYEEFLKKIKNRSMIRLNTKVTTENKIITLSTCYNNYEKMVVHGKLIKQEKRY